MRLPCSVHYDDPQPQAHLGDNAVVLSVPHGGQIVPAMDPFNFEPESVDHVTELAEQKRHEQRVQDALLQQAKFANRKEKGERPWWQFWSLR